MTIKLNGKYTDAEIKTDDVDDTTIEQLQELVNNEAFTNPVKVMPDAHAGAGAVIGFTMKAGDKICPNTVGVDIGCGMYAIKLDENVTPRDFVKAVYKVVPMGKDVHDNPKEILDEQVWQTIKMICENIGYSYERARKSLGTLGGGNHFIELSEDTEGNQWIVIHSGSRGFGFNVSKYHQDKAIEQREKLNTDKFTYEELQYITDGRVDYDKIKKDYNGKEIQEIGNSLTNKILEQTAVENEDLAWLEGDAKKEYMKDMTFAQIYAKKNRRKMMSLILEKLGRKETDRIHSPHNFISLEDNIIRKGATPAREGERAIVSFNMADGSIIIEGKGNPDWNYSAPHGAGRRMSRTKAKEQLTVKEFAKDMDDVFSLNKNKNTLQHYLKRLRCHFKFSLNINKNTLDEAPRAYKDTSTIKEAIKPTGKIIETLKSVANVKADT